jgi:hypothetical protein
MKASKAPLEDSRKRFDGKPLRQSWHLPFLSRPMTSSVVANKSHKEYFLYEAQISVTVTGFDDSVWTAYGCIDTYFGSRESVSRYHRWKGSKGLGKPDPLARGQIEADLPIWMPREYFLRIFEIRIKEVQSEWHRITDKVEAAVNKYVFCVAFVRKWPAWSDCGTKIACLILAPHWWCLLGRSQFPVVSSCGEE